MAIDPSISYRLVYATGPFASHTAFLQGLRGKYPSLEIPYLDAGDLAPEARDAVDQYLYVRDDENAASVVSAIRSAASRARVFPGRLEELGVVSGGEVAQMLDRFRIERESATQGGGWFRVTSPGFYRNKKVFVAGEPDPELPEGSVRAYFYIFGRQREIIVERVNLVPTRPNVDPLSSYTNCLATARWRKAVILDADTELREACCRCDNLYTRAEEEDLARAVARGEAPPRWGRFVGGSHGMYFTISRFRMLYPEYELHVVFDERPEGPKAGSGSPSFREAYRQNREWVKRFVRACGLHVYDRPGQRAEDVIGSLVQRMSGDLDYRNVIIATKGTAYYPLVSSRVQLTLPKVNFRDHPQTITVRDALARFGLSDEAQLHRIYWLQALTGDVTGTPSVNLFNKQAGHRWTGIRQADYLPHILSATNLADLKLRLLAHEAFHPFIQSGQFDRNLAELMLNTSLLDGANLDAFRILDETGAGKVDQEQIRALLIENNFHKEVEYLEWTIKVVKSLVPCV